MDPLDPGWAPWELPDPYFNPEEHALHCWCDVCQMFDEEPSED
jgi:hypothetical protein